MGTAVCPASTTPASWGAHSDVDAFVDEVLGELTAMAADGTRPTRRGPRAPLTGAALRKVIFSWITLYRRLNTIVERTKEHLVAFVQIAFVSILSRRLKWLMPQEVST